MLKLFNDMEPFFKDCYRRINVREYSRIKNISPPSASKLLTNLEKENLLKRETDRNYIYYFANKDNKVFVDISRIYWFKKIKNSGFIEHIEKELIDPLVILFGSFSKAEIKEDSDIDFAIFTNSGKEINIKSFEKKLKRKIHLIRFKKDKKVENENLFKNILNGFIISGSW